MQNKILTLDELQDKIKILKETGKTIVFTNGCFDLLHIGHTRYLQKAKSLGDVLIVAINSDDSVKKIKGETRPIIPQNERSEIIASLECVNYVIIFNEITPNKIIEILKPDIHVKGGDYKIDDLPEATIVKNYGGKLVIVDEIKEKSSSNIIKKIKSR